MLANMPERRVAERWKKMAEEARAIAERLRDPASKQAMLEIAAGYDRLATRAAESARARGGRRSQDPGD
ncbi:MAG: hypothetical protein WDN25_13550 [Acetobacteraceae bacterium]